MGVKRERRTAKKVVEVEEVEEKEDLGKIVLDDGDDDDEDEVGQSSGGESEEGSSSTQEIDSEDPTSDEEEDEEDEEEEGDEDEEEGEKSEDDGGEDDDGKKNGMDESSVATNAGADGSVYKDGKLELVNTAGLKGDADAKRWKLENKDYYNSDSDSSLDDARRAMTTIGNVPREWYDELDHIGYDLNGKPISKALHQKKKDQLDQFLARMDDPNFSRTVVDEVTGEEVVLSKEEMAMIKRIQEGKVADGGYDEHEQWVDFFHYPEGQIHPISNAPEPKRRFLPSIHEHKKVMKIVRAIREGRIVPKQKAGPKYHYDVWADEDEERNLSNTAKTRERMHVPPPKAKLPGHAESYNPPEEYLPTPEELAEWEALDPEERPYNFIPQKYNSLREVPLYKNFIKERFERCLDLYLCPRVRRTRLNIDPESLIPKLPKPRDLEPFPTTLSICYEGHKEKIRSISVDTTGQWLVSGSDDKTVRVWEVDTGRCVKVIKFDHIVHAVNWNPNSSLSIIAVASGHRLYFVDPKVGSEEQRAKGHQLVKEALATQSEDSPVEWRRPTPELEVEGIVLEIIHQRTVKQAIWHWRGDYIATLASDPSATHVFIHQLSRGQSQNPFKKSKGQIQCVAFHPSKPFFFVATQRYVRLYNLAKQELAKKFQPGVKWISSIAVHPAGDNFVIGTYDKRVCWFDMDLSSKPYKMLRYHKNAVRSVAFHPRYPLFASAADDRAVNVFHGMVYDDLLQNPLIVPVKILRGHETVKSLGVLCTVFHPTQPWLFSSGADGKVHLYVH